LLSQEAVQNGRCFDFLILAVSGLSFYRSGKNPNILCFIQFSQTLLNLISFQKNVFEVKASISLSVCLNDENMRKKSSWENLLSNKKCFLETSL
jgi:hypothetical protein